MLSGSGLSLSSSQGTALVSQLWVSFSLIPGQGSPALALCLLLCIEACRAQFSKAEAPCSKCLVQAANCRG